MPFTDLERELSVADGDRGALSTYVLENPVAVRSSTVDEKIKALRLLEGTFQAGPPDSLDCQRYQRAAAAVLRESTHRELADIGAAFGGVDRVNARIRAYSDPDLKAALREVLMAELPVRK